MSKNISLGLSRFPFVYLSLIQQIQHSPCLYIISTFFQILVNLCHLLDFFFLWDRIIKTCFSHRFVPSWGFALLRGCFKNNVTVEAFSILLRSHFGMPSNTVLRQASFSSVCCSCKPRVLRFSACSLLPYVWSDCIHCVLQLLNLFDVETHILPVQNLVFKVFKQ